MENNPQDPSKTAMTVTVTDIENKPKRKTELEEMKEDMAAFAVEAILEDPKTKDMIKMAQPFVKPALKQLVNELGDDDVRFMLYIDRDSGAVVFQRLPTATIKEFSYEEPIEDDLFILKAEDIENVEDLIKKLLTRFAPKFM